MSTKLKIVACFIILASLICYGSQKIIKKTKSQEGIQKKELVQDTASFKTTSDSIALKAKSDTSSLEDQEKIIAQKNIERFPDTMFSSVSDVIFEVEISDTSSSGKITSFDDPYEKTPGTFIFRGGLKRNTPHEGKITGTPSKISVEWKFKTFFDNTQTKLGVWGGGSGWTGQPIYVHWPDSIKEKFINESKNLTSNFTEEEIMVGSLSSHIYFIDFKSGKASRKAIDVNNPIKGSISLDPSLNGNLYFGQGVPKSDTVPFGAGVIDLYQHKITHFFKKDPKAWRNWGAYDSNPVVVGDFLIRPAENGKVYKFIREKGNLKLHSSIRYHIKNEKTAGIESSIAVYKNYGYFGDNYGNIICLNLDTMKPVWLYRNHDDTDATPVIDVEGDTPYVYTASEMDKQGDSGICYFVKLNGLNGEKIWEIKFPVDKAKIGTKSFDGGMYSTPLIGRGDCDSLIIVPICFNKPKFKGDLVGINRYTGKVIYRTPLDRYAWSSPVPFYNEENKLFVALGDCFGNMYLFEGSTGKILFKTKVGDNFESSPIVINNNLVVGSRGNTIYKLKIE